MHVRGAGSESLATRQFTAHVFINAAKEEGHAKGCIDMICRGTGTRISRLEKQSYNSNVNVRFQPKAWVDRNVMKKLQQPLFSLRGKIMVMTIFYLSVIILMLIAVKRYWKFLRIQTF